jgi:hypothetical protein
MTEREMIINARPCVRDQALQFERLASLDDRPHYRSVYEAEATKLRDTLTSIDAYLGLDKETVI